MQSYLKGFGTITKERPEIKAKSKGEEKSSRPIPWVEKYRPQRVEELSHQEEVVAVLQKSLQGADLPNLLFYGPPGTGKTSAILAAAKELFGPDQFRDRVLELNASDERGIQVIREKVKNFAMAAASSHTHDGRPCPSFKLIILDEADSMTNPAQAALRRMMELHAKSTRFCLLCNYITRIIEPITSRCSKFRFTPLSENAMQHRIEHIAKKENLAIGDDAMSALLTVCEGDLRRAITCLQSASRIHITSDPISAKEISAAAESIPDDQLQLLVHATRSDSVEKVIDAVKLVLAEGHSAAQITNQLFDILLREQSGKNMARISRKIAEVDHRLTEGADEFLQLLDLLCFIMKITCHSA